MPLGKRHVRGASRHGKPHGHAREGSQSFRYRRDLRAHPSASRVEPNTGDTWQEPHPSEPWYPLPYTGGTPVPLSKSPKAIAFWYELQSCVRSGIGATLRAVRRTWLRARCCSSSSGSAASLCPHGGGPRSMRAAISTLHPSLLRRPHQLRAARTPTPRREYRQTRHTRCAARPRSAGA
jgi:hypothetical protein